MKRIYFTQRCPVCGCRIFLNSHGYQCECCLFHISYYVCNRHISPDEAERIVAGQKLILDGFSTKSGNVFSSIPVVEGYSIRLDNTVDNIPGLGGIIVGNKGFVVDMKDDGHRSRLRIQRMYNGHMLNIAEVKALLHNGSVQLETFDDEGYAVIHRLRFEKNKQKVVFLRC